jgi:thiamine biosynthesis lipoprotein
VLVDVGGDIAVRGVAAESWPIAIEDPRGTGTDPLDIVLLRFGGIGTSGRDYRHWRRSGAAMHHIIDPCTGAPARTDVFTATVIAPSAVEADASAKRLLLMGSEAGAEWVETRPDLAALVVRDDGEVVRTSRFTNYVWKEAA